MAAQERLSGLSAFLTSVLYPSPASAEDLHIEPDPDPFPYVTRHIMLPEGTPSWQAQLFDRYGGLERLGVGGVGPEVEDILKTALHKVGEILKWVRKCRDLCEVEGQRAVKKSDVWEDWKEMALSWEEGAEVDEEMEMSY